MVLRYAPRRLFQFMFRLWPSCVILMAQRHFARSRFYQQAPIVQGRIDSVDPSMKWGKGSKFKAQRAGLRAATRLRMSREFNFRSGKSFTLLVCEKKKRERNR